MPFLSIITPTYNRSELIPQSIDSALKFAELATLSVEIIVVDDASTDGTAELIEDLYRRELSAGTLEVIRSDKRLGVTGARNIGVVNASGEWLLFTDSDDLLIPEAALNMLKILQDCNAGPIIFFRCVELETDRLIGPHYEAAYDLSLRDFLNSGTPGECLPAVKSSIFSQFLFNAELKGCEGFTYAQIIRDFGPARVETLAVRKYRTDCDDRLSSRKGLKSRACQIAKYHSLVLRDFHRDLYVATMLKTSAKIIYYMLHCVLTKFKYDK